MKRYQDITLIPGDDLGIHFLWEKVYQQVHIALVEHKNAEGLSDCGVAFPELRNGKFCKMGKKLRLFAKDQSALEKLNINNWLERLSDYVHITSIREVPEKHEYIQYQRLQPKSSKERLARRKAKRHDISLEEAYQSLEGFSEERVDVPFVVTKSLSNGHKFRLFITTLKGDSPGKQVFTHYGLSKTGYVPMF